MADFSHLPTHAKFVALMPQWDFLDFLAERASAIPVSGWLMSAEVDGLIEEEGTMAGVTAKTKDGQLTIRADLTIGADGRHSLVRRKAGFAPLDIGAPMDVLWFKLSRQTTDAGALLGRIDAGQILAVFNRGDYWQCAYVIAKGSADRLKAQGIGALREKIAALAPFSPIALASLRVLMTSSSSPSRSTGCRFGTSPGFCASATPRMRCRRSAASASISRFKTRSPRRIFLALPLSGKGPLSDQLLAQVQKRREWPTKVIQGVQVIIQRNVISRVLGGTGKAVLPWPAALQIFPGPAAAARPPHGSWRAARAGYVAGAGGPASGQSYSD